ncbi:MAG: HD domain-containing protein [Methanosarcinales archaeon]
MRNALVISGTDGHGAIMGVISKKKCDYKVCGKPKEFWGNNINNIDFEKYSLVMFVDLPLTMEEDAAENGISKIGDLVDAGKTVYIIDHHKMSKTHYHKVIEKYAEVIIASSPMVCYYGSHSKIVDKWARIGAICDRDPIGLLPLAEEKLSDFDQKMQELEEIAIGVDYAVRIPNNMETVLKAIENNDFNYFKQFTEKASTSLEGVDGAPEVIGKVAIVPETEYNLAFKQLSKISEDKGTDYALGYCFSERKDEGPKITAITYWKSDALPVALKLGLSKFIGHAEAPRITPKVTEGDKEYIKEKAYEEMKEIAEKLNSNKIYPKEVQTKGDIFYYVSQFFQKVNIPYFLTSHGWNHVQNVIGNARSLGSLFGLSEDNQKLLDFAALLHDIGNGANTVYEGISNEEAREKEDWNKQGLFKGILIPVEVEKVKTLVYSHRKKANLPEDEVLRTLTILLRVADSVDIDASRAMNDKGEYLKWKKR